MVLTHLSISTKHKYVNPGALDPGTASFRTNAVANGKEVVKNGSVVIFFATAGSPLNADEMVLYTLSALFIFGFTGFVILRSFLARA